MEQCNISVNDCISEIQKQLSKMQNVPEKILNSVASVENGLKFFEFHHLPAKKFCLHILDSINKITLLNFSEKQIAEELDMAFWYLQALQLIINERL